MTFSFVTWARQTVFIDRTLTALLGSMLLGCSAAPPVPAAAQPPSASKAANTCTETAPPRGASGKEAPSPRRVRYLLKHDSGVMVRETAPHGGVGATTAYRYFDELADAGLIFRKRALHPGASNGLNVLKHDEVFYVLSGRGELEVDGDRLALEPGTAVFMYLGASIRLRQLGDEDLVVIIAYPPARTPDSAVH